MSRCCFRPVRFRRRSILPAAGARKPDTSLCRFACCTLSPSSSDEICQRGHQVRHTSVVNFRAPCVHTLHSQNSPFFVRVIFPSLFSYLLGAHSKLHCAFRFPRAGRRHTRIPSILPLRRLFHANLHKIYTTRRLYVSCVASRSVRIGDRATRRSPVSHPSA